MNRAGALFFASAPLLVLVVLSGLLWGQARSAPREPATLEPAAETQLVRGAQLYRLVCSDCHGNTGGGISEGKLNFLPEHRACEGCHRPHNAPTLTNVRLSERNSFSIGDPPPLTEAALSRFGTAAALHGYLRAAMPRYAPGSLTEQDYLDLTAFLLALSGKLPDGLTLDETALASLALR